MSNTQQYYDRMFDSAAVSTKGLIPNYVHQMVKQKKGPTRILDVGCADGRFTECIFGSISQYDVTIDGIDSSAATIESLNTRAAAKKRDKRIAFKNEHFNEDFCNRAKKDGLYDIVIFSSVMHEISSYCTDTKIKYTKAPIAKSIQLASDILNPSGRVIIRDMIKPSHRHPKPIATEFKNFEAMKYFMLYISVCPYLKKWFNHSAQSKFMAYDSGDRIIFNIREDILMEFLMTFTWGTESFPRESIEKKFILDKADWSTAIRNAGLTCRSMMTSNEQYPEYFDEIVRIWQGKWTYPATTCLIIADKPR